MSIWQFMGDYPWLTFFCLYLICLLIENIYARTMRHLNIKQNGWPPEHLDADGDFKEVPK